MRRTRQSDYRALTLSLSHRSFWWDYDIAPSMHAVYPNTVRYMGDLKNGPLFSTKRIAKDSGESSSG